MFKTHELHGFMFGTPFFSGFQFQTEQLYRDVFCNSLFRNKNEQNTQVTSLSTPPSPSRVTRSHAPEYQNGFQTTLSAKERPPPPPVPRFVPEGMAAKQAAARQVGKKSPTHRRWQPHSGVAVSCTGLPCSPPGKSPINFTRQSVSPLCSIV